MKFYVLHSKKKFYVIQSKIKFIGSDNFLLQNLVAELITSFNNDTYYGIILLWINVNFVHKVI